MNSRMQYSPSRNDDAPEATDDDEREAEWLKACPVELGAWQYHQISMILERVRSDV